MHMLHTNAHEDLRGEEKQWKKATFHLSSLRINLEHAQADYTHSISILVFSASAVQGL